MNLLSKIFLQKTALICSALLLSACGGGASTKSSIPSTEDLQTIADNVVAQQLLIAAVPKLDGTTGVANTNEIVSAAAGVDDAGLPATADVYVGTVDLPYYFDTSNSTTSFWLPSLDVRETLTVPLLMTFPNVGEMPTTGWPVVMFQHGITQDRTNLFAIAHAFASVGYAAIAIDLPAHGITDAGNPFNAVNSTFPTDVEQTYGQNETSGENFINLRSLLTSRDNLRQGAANLLTLRKSLGGIINAATGTSVTIDTSKVGLVAHSLGGMIAVDYLGVETTPTPTSILTSGATVSMVLQDSESFSPVINAGLAELGVTTEAGIAAFYANAQELIDAGEPANYAALAAATHPIHLVKVVDDMTVPNSSTENLAILMGATSVNETTAAIDPGSPGIVTLTAGSHSSPLDPGTTVATLAATTEIQQQVAVFQLTSGAVIRICNADVVEDAAADAVVDPTCP